MAQAGRITVGIENANATVMLDNPAQYNALTKGMCLQLGGACATLAADPAVRTIVLRGAGSSFCSGIAIDQTDRVLFDPDEQSALINHLDLVERSIQTCGKTTIAVVEGNCYGGGWQLASACDIQLAQLLEEQHANSQYSIERTKEAIVLAVAGEGSDGWWDAVWEENAGNADLAEGHGLSGAPRPEVRLLTR